MNRINIKNPACKTKLVVVVFSLVFFIAGFMLSAAAQEQELRFSFDASANAIALPKAFMPNVDLGGRGYSVDKNWPQELASSETLHTWQKDIGFNGVYRLQYDLWEISQLAKDEEAQAKLLENYEKIIKNISDSGGVVILNLFGTSRGLGRVLDKRSSPAEMKVFKTKVKSYIRELSCNKKYNVWYEVWNAPDLEDFFLDRKQEYLNLYKAVAEAVKELRDETKIFIPVGGPSVSWWFQNLEGNSIIRPERSLIYELIKFCHSYKLPLDFISWHAYSTDPKVDKEKTPYNKTAVELIRDWLEYFNFDRNTPLIVDEWNYDSGINIVAERGKKSFIAASYIPSRISNMHEAGLDYQLYFALEDFGSAKEGVFRNTGIFWIDQDTSRYKGGPKAIYNVYRMLAAMKGNQLLLTKQKLEDDFVGIIVTRKEQDLTIMVYNYIDPDIGKNYLSRTVSDLTEASRKELLMLVKSGQLEEVIKKTLDINTLRLRPKLVAALKRAQELNDKAVKWASEKRSIKLDIKQLKGDYVYQKYVVDSSCPGDCDFKPTEEKNISVSDSFEENLSLNPYSVNMIVIKKKSAQEQLPAAAVSAGNAGSVSENKSTQ